jgi:hypothetical protein
MIHEVEAEHRANHAKTLNNVQTGDSAVAQWKTRLENVRTTDSFDLPRSSKPGHRTLDAADVDRIMNSIKDLNIRLLKCDAAAHAILLRRKGDAGLWSVGNRRRAYL